MLFKTCITIFIALLFSGCAHNDPEPCVPIIIKEPLEIKVPIKCVHPLCDAPLLYQFDKNASYTINAKYLKINNVLKDKYTKCLESSIFTCEGSGLTKPE